MHFQLFMDGSESHNYIAIGVATGDPRNLADQLKFVFSKKATKIDEIFTVDLTLCSKCQKKELGI